jgi:hypothetical protein
VKLEFPANAISPTAPGPTPSAISLNPIEQKLRSTWYLRQMSIKDTLYNDSLIIRNRLVEFSEFAYPSRNRPILNDHALLNAKGDPDIYGLWASEEYT